MSISFMKDYGHGSSLGALLRCSMSDYKSGMKLQSDEDRQSGPSGPTPTIFEAIVRQRCVEATYNRMRATLAPHVIYTKHGDLFIDAVTVEREGKPPREEKLGTFKLAGLGELVLTERAFAISRLFEREAERYEGAALMMVEESSIPA
jgi:hypothetical protein